MLISAHLKHHAGPPLTRMSPQVRIKIGDFEWFSPVVENGGHDVHWATTSSKFEYNVRDPNLTVRIEVLDHKN